MYESCESAGVYVCQGINKDERGKGGCIGRSFSGGLFCVVSAPLRRRADCLAIAYSGEAEDFYSPRLGLFNGYVK